MGSPKKEKDFGKCKCSLFKVKRQVKVQRCVSVVKVKVKKKRTQASSTNVLAEKSDIDGASKLLARSINDVSAVSQVDAAPGKKTADRVPECSPSPSLQVKKRFEKSSSTKIASAGRTIKSTSSRPMQYHDSLLYSCPESYDCPYGFKHADFEPFLVGSKSTVTIRKAADLDKVVIIDAYGDIEVVATVTGSATD